MKEDPGWRYLYVRHQQFVIMDGRLRKQQHVFLIVSEIQKSILT